MITDDSNIDDAAVAVIRASLPGRASSALMALVQRAWSHSQTRRVAIGLAAQPAAARVRLCAVMTATAGLAALILTRFAAPVWPFVWIPPAVVLAVSIVVLASRVAPR